MFVVRTSSGSHRKAFERALLRLAQTLRSPVRRCSARSSASLRFTSSTSRRKRAAMPGRRAAASLFFDGVV